MDPALALPATSMTTSTAVATIADANAATPDVVAKTENAARLAEGTTDSATCATAKVFGHFYFLDSNSSKDNLK